jgi:rhodanese-related sulfurtransferase
MKGSLHILLFASVLGVTTCGAQSQYRDPNALSRIVAEKSEAYILVDVRSPAEFSEGHIPTAVNIPVAAIAKQVPTTDKAALIIVYCRSGARSAMAKKTLDDLGYANVVDFGGLNRWPGELEAENSQK